MNYYSVLVILCIVSLSFVSCNKSEIVDNSIPIRSELPYCSYFYDSLDSANKVVFLGDIEKGGPTVIQSEDELQIFLNYMEDILDENFRVKYPEYTSFDFSKHTMIVQCFLDAYAPENLVRSISSFYSRDNLPFKYESDDDFSYCYLQYRDYNVDSTISDETPLLIYVSGILVDKIPANEKVTSIVSYSLRTSGM